MVDSAIHGMSAERRQAISDCKAAHKACLEAAAYCEGQGGQYCENERVQLLRECADLCERTAASLQDNAEPNRELGERCAEVCARVGKELHDLKDDPQMLACAQACLRCASELKKLAAPPPADYDKAVADSFPASDPPSETVPI